MKKSVSRLSLLALCACVAAQDQDTKQKIKNVKELLTFKDNVNSGTSYSGTTVFLDADIDFSGGLSEQFEPIGKSNSKYFRGTFDGQGHTIRNLAINSSSQYTGLFGYSNGATIRNVVLDSSCSVVSSYSGKNWASAYLGGIIGNCRNCVIENIVNMASVAFIGNTYLYIGGIAGYLYYSVTIKNCANYGSVTHSGTAYYARIGGIAGYSYGSSSNKIYIQNCLNYGTINHSGTTKYSLYIGRVLGYTYYNNIENCVSGGKITPNKQDNCYIGSVVGYASSSTIIEHCYWTSDDGYSKVCGTGNVIVSESISFNSITFKLNETVSVGKYTGISLLLALNAAADHYYQRDYSHWLHNKDNKEISFTINNRAKPLTLDTQLILLPSLASERKLWFDGWYTDNSCTKPLTDFEITSDTPLYGKWEENNNNYTITFDTRGGSPVEPITELFGSTVKLPKNVYREYCTVAWWENDYRDKVPFDFTVPARNITLHAVWLCTHISTAEDFVDFSKIVNSGTSYYYGTTVFLDADIDFSGFSEQFEPIGKSNSKYFRGTFDGQGHTISNLVINSSSSEYVGLFGYSNGATIRNVVLDSSCSVASSYSDYPYVGGVIGYCYGCTIENTVSMASVAFIGNTSNWLYLGGIVGRLYASSKEGNVRNCANYGSIKCSGTSYSAYIGGIAGECYGGSMNILQVHNCLNQGNLIHDGYIRYSAWIGGVIGYISYGEIENCANCGGLTVTGQGTKYVGSIAGTSSRTNILHCYWLENREGNITKYNATYIKEQTNLSNTSTFYPNSNGLDTVSRLLNDNLQTGWSKWLPNPNNVTIDFIINCRKRISLSSQLILLPDIVCSPKDCFDGWFTNKRLSEKLSSLENKEGSLTLFSRCNRTVMYCSINATLVHPGGEVSEYSYEYGEALNLPETTSTEKHSNIIWFSDKDMKNEFTEKIARGYDLFLYGKKVTSKRVVTVMSLSDPDTQPVVTGFDESAKLDGMDGRVCMDELCEEVYKGEFLDDDSTFFYKP